MPESGSKSAGRSASKSKKGAPKKHTYLEMVQMSIITLNERGGSTRQEIWKCMEARFPEADQKRYLIAFKKMRGEDGPVIQGKTTKRFTLNKSFLAKALRRIEMGLPLQHVLSSSRMTDPIKKKMKMKKKMTKKAKKKSNKKNSKSAGKGKKANAGKGKGKGGAKSTKDKIKQKAKDNKKTAGSKKAKDKVEGKRAKTDKKVDAKTKANTNSAKKAKDAKSKASKTPVASKRQSKAGEKAAKSSRESTATRKSAKQEGNEKLDKSKDIRKSNKSRQSKA